MEIVESKSLNLICRFEESSSEEERKSILIEYIETIENDDTAFKINNSSELFSGAPCINCDQNFEPNNFCGKLVLLDFFTYCCINCIHIMPFLHDLESKFSIEDGLLLIGVHSAKFPNEKVEKNILLAINRYNITHPVINDSDIKIWSEFSVKCWPTLIFISPNSKVLLSVAGESHSSFVELFSTTALELYCSKKELNEEKLPFLLKESYDSVDGPDKEFRLNFPGKLAIDATGESMAISDSGNNRIVVADILGHVKQCIGGTEAGFHDGDFETARFNAPQGLCWHGKTAIFVADCNNHAVRKIDLQVGTVITVCGTGLQGNDFEGGNSGLEQPISSPWDVVVAGSPCVPNGRSLLYIAMSGIHQIWTFFLEKSDFQKGRELEMATCIRYAGSGREENRNNTYPHKAGFAQPSGLAHDEQGHSIYIADSESSTIRKMSLSNGAVQALVGGDIDPSNLFAYGDVDGKGRTAKLQHPIGIEWDKARNVLYVADTYNNKIKIVDPKLKTCTTMKGMINDNGKSVFNEPSGLSISPSCKYLYVADTNNHQVKIISLEDFSIRKLVLKLNDTLTAYQKNVKFLTGARVAERILNHIKCSRDQDIRVVVSCGDKQLNSEAPSSWQISFQNPYSDALYLVSSGVFTTNTEISVSFQVLDFICEETSRQLLDGYELAKIYVESILYYCEKGSDVCRMLPFKAAVPIELSLQSELSPSEVFIVIS